MRKLELAVNLLIPIGSIAIGLLIACLLNPSLTIAASLTCFGIGLALLLHAKCGLFQRGIWFSFGPALMNAAARIAYRRAYGFLGCGVVLSLISLVTLYKIG